MRLVSTKNPTPPESVVARRIGAAERANHASPEDRWPKQKVGRQPTRDAVRKSGPYKDLQYSEAV
jgi:hypothetical protein